MNCVSCVVIFFYVLELTQKTQVFKRKNTAGISSNDKYMLLLLLQLVFKVPSISTHAGSQTSTPLIHCRTNDVIQVAPLLYQSLHQVVDVTSIRKWQCWRRHYFRPSFYKNNISAMDRLVVVKFHKDIGNRWLFMIQRKTIILYS